jgi:predicted ATPase
MRLFFAAGDTLVFAEETLKFQKTGYSAPQVMSLEAGHYETRIRKAADDNESTAKVFRHLLGQCRVYHFHDTSATAPMRQYSAIGDNRFLRPDAGNLAAMLYAYKQSSPVAYQRMVATIQKVMPEFDDFVLEPDRLNPRDILLNWQRKGFDYTFGPHQLSDGSLRAIAIITLLLQPEADLPKVIILDEPELGLHPYAVEIIAGLIQSASVRTQLMVATQSPTFLEHFALEDIIVVESNGQGSQYCRKNPDQFQEWLEDYSLGELWQRNVLGGGPLP